MLALVLHSHMPYVEGFGTYPFGEEWLFDAVLRSYLPVLEVADRLTMTVTPVLADQLEAPGLAERLEAFGEEFRLGSCLLDAEEQDGDFRAPCLDEAERYRRGLARLRDLGGPLAAFQEAAADGRVSLMTSSATHAVLPLIATDSARDAQLDAGLRSHRRRFGEPDGIWLPECAYSPGLEELVSRHGLSHFCVDASAHEEPFAALRPIATEAGPVAFPIDWEAVSWLWSLGGYPSDPLHTDFHRESLRGARVWSIGGEIRDPEAGAARAREQAREFLAAISGRLADYRERAGSDGLIVFAIDTELLGHWWWEGPEWLAEVMRSAQDCRGRAGHARGGDRARGTRGAADPTARAGASTRTFRPGTRPRSPIWPGAPGGSSCGWCASLRPGRSRPSEPSGRRASSLPSRQATGRFWTSAARRAITRSNG